MQRSNVFFQIGGIVGQARGGQGIGRRADVMEAQGRRGDGITRRFKFFLQPVQGPGTAKGAMDHQDRWFPHAYLPSAAMTPR
jgi:hypothetical protein